MSFKVLFPNDIAQLGKAFLKDRGYEVVMGAGNDEASLLRDIADADAVLASAERYSRRILEAGKKLKVIARFGVGYDAIDLEAATELGVQITNTPFALTNAVAEHTVALLLACAKQIGYMDKRVRAHDWNKSRRDYRHISVEVSGKTLGLVGLGNIGRLVAKKAMDGFGMKVVAHDPYLPADKHPAGIARAASLEELFATADFISLHTPSTPETRGSINRSLFAKMKKTAFFVNCARGDVVNEPDLIAALADGRIAGAALDVLESEPPKPDNPLLAMDNVVLLPHTASFTTESMDAMGMHAAQSIDEVLSGRPVTWPVNKIRGHA